MSCLSLNEVMVVLDQREKNNITTMGTNSLFSSDEEPKQKISSKTIVALVVVVVVILVVGAIIYFSLTSRQQPAEPIAPLPKNPTTQDITPGVLPTSNGDTASETLANRIEELAKEQQFISAFYQPISYTLEPVIRGFTLPLNSIKEETINYRDFDRKINIEPYLEHLATTGSLLLTQPFDQQPATWSDALEIIKKNELPIFVTSDTIIGTFLDTTQIIYKEIEEERFYPALWNTLQGLATQAEKKYIARQQEFGIETDLLTEAYRLELLYLSVALDLLAPDDNQIRESLAQDKVYFTPQEAQRYSFSELTTLSSEITEEVQRITNARESLDSPTFLYTLDYSQFSVPAEYASSEKLKNYYLALTWLKQGLFPLWSTEDNCTDCLLDESDHRIAFIASLLLTEHLANDQELQNDWADIYKSIAFFKGLESNMTYLTYHKALQDTFGDEYSIETLFEDSQTVDSNIAALQTTLTEVEFPTVLGGKKDNPEQAGLRLLRDTFVLEDAVYDSIVGPDTGFYIENENADTPLPASACRTTSRRDVFERCSGLSLDLAHLLGSNLANVLLSESRNNEFTNYSPAINKFRTEINAFDQTTWHDNIYLSLFEALLPQLTQGTQVVPEFMRHSAWQAKNLTTFASMWATQHRSVSPRKTTPQGGANLGAYFGYGYLEPQPELYARLLATTRMIKDGFTELNIISTSDKMYDRLIRLEQVLDQTLAISQKELQNIPLEAADYNFINDFSEQIRAITGDVLADNLSYDQKISLKFERQTLHITLDGLAYIVVIYPDVNGQPLLAIGPIVNYREETNGINISNLWQSQLQTTN